MENIKEERKGFESLGLSYKPHDEVKIEGAELAGVHNYWFTPQNIVSREVVIHFHGGGFIYGSIESHRAMVSHLAAALSRRILLVEYSLAPEKPFPFALNEATAVIKELLQRTPGFQFALMGDSAGGNLALSTALNLKKLKLTLPLYQVLLSPWLNMKTEYASYVKNEKNDPVISKTFVDYAASLYSGGHNLDDPLLSPVHGDFIDFNPTLILVGEKEVLRDDSIQLHSALKKAGSDSVLKVFEEVTHVWPLTNITSPDSKEALRIIREFVDRIK